MDEEVERPVVDVVGDRRTKGFGGLAAEDDVETGLLSWRNHLRERTTLLELWVLINKETDVYVLPQVVGDDKALGGGGLDEDGLEVDLLWSCIDLLQLLPGELDAAVPDLCLGLGLCLPLSLHDPVLVCFSSVSETREVRLRRLVAVDGLLHIEEVDLRRHLESWGGHPGVHTEVRILLDLLQGLRRQPACRLESLLDLSVSFTILALFLEEIAGFLLVLLNVHELRDRSNVAS